MNCSDFKLSLVEFLDGRLPADRAAASRAHLEACSECRREADLHRRTWELAGRLPAVEPAADFGASVRRRVRRSRFIAVVGSCAAAALLAATIFLAVQKDPRPAPETEFAKLPQEDRTLLEALATDRTWELADNIELIRAYELLDGGAAPPEEDH
jgi:anti-sigma factor RsiW